MLSRNTRRQGLNVSMTSDGNSQDIADKTLQPKIPLLYPKVQLEELVVPDKMNADTSQNRYFGISRTMNSFRILSKKRV
jgi:hypothetical protein